MVLDMRLPASNKIVIYPIWLPPISLLYPVGIWKFFMLDQANNPLNQSVSVVSFLSKMSEHSFLDPLLRRER